MLLLPPADIQLHLHFHPVLVEYSGKQFNSKLPYLSNRKCEEQTNNKRKMWVYMHLLSILGISSSYLWDSPLCRSYGRAGHCRSAHSATIRHKHITSVNNRHRDKIRDLVKREVFWLQTNLAGVLPFGTFGKLHYNSLSFNRQRGLERLQNLKQLRCFLLPEHRSLG